MRFFIILWLAAWLLAARPVLAQAPPLASTAVQVNPLAAAPIDTAAALHRYFAQRRHNGRVSLGMGSGLVAASALTAVVGGQQGSWAGLGYVVLGTAGTIVSLPVVIRGIVLTAKYSEVKEQRAVQAWQQRRLPGRLARRALNPAFSQNGGLL